MFRVLAPCLGVVKPELMALRLLCVAADQRAAAGFQRLGGFFPDHQFQRVTTPVSPHAVVLTHRLGARQAGTTSPWFTCGQRRRMDFGRGIDHQLRGRSPDGPDTERAERKAGLRRQRWQRVLAAPGRHEGHLHRAAALAGHVGPAPVAGAQHAQRDAVAIRPLWVAQFDTKRGLSLGKHWLGRYQIQG